MKAKTTIFGNVIPEKVIKKSHKNNSKLIKKFGDDSTSKYDLVIQKNEVLGPILGVKNITQSSSKVEKLQFDEKSIIIGNIRMGFGHYRISMAIASAAFSMGYTPYWFDLHSFDQTTGGKVIKHLNELYSFGSRLSQKSKLFNRFYWEPLNSEGFKKLDYNAQDQEMAKLMVPIFHQLPKNIPYIATHVWPAQAAYHAKVRTIVNVIPDNWPMGLHLAEGTIHTVQTPSAYFGYRTLKGMSKNSINQPMPENSLFNVGHYIDHELVSNLEQDTRRRQDRQENNEPMRFLLTVGGAGAQKEIFLTVILKLLPLVVKGKVTLFINIGDHRKLWDEMVQDHPQLNTMAVLHMDAWKDTRTWCENGLEASVKGLHVFCHKDIFAAVYSTNMLMRMSDVLVTKPSELAYYPIPKLLIKRIGGHEAYGAIRASEIGDGTLECETVELTLQMVDMLIQSKEIFREMNQHILKAKSIGIYDGAYNVVRLALKN